MVDAVADGAGQLMDAIYGRQRFIYDATRKFYLLGRDGVIRDLAPPHGGHVLEIACGTGRNLVAIARRYPQTRCHGLDVSHAMLTTARASIARAGLATRIDLAEADATSFDSQRLFGTPAFDRVVISYALSMIPEWPAVLHRAATALAPGGSLHVVDFGDQTGLHRGFKSMLRRWLARFHVQPRDGLTDTAEAIAKELGLTCECRRLYRGYALRIRLSRPHPNA